MTTPQLPNAEGALREWFRAQAQITMLCGQRQYFSLPRADELTYPLMVFYRVGGAPDERGWDHPDFIVECWGTTKFEASNLGLVVASVIADSCNRAPIDTEHAHVASGTVNSGPIESGGIVKAKRYRIDATFHIRAR